MIENKTSRLFFLFSWVILFTYGLRSLTEPDIWWQLRSGAWIWEHGAIPVKDVLSYTFEGESWTNVKWLSEVLYYFIASISDPVMINVFCGIVFLCIGILIYKRVDSNFATNARVYAILIFAFISSYRMNGRPEMFSYLFTALYLFVFNRAILNFHWLWVLVPIQVLWSNMHEAFAVGVIMATVYAIIQFFQSNQNRWMLLIWVSFIWLAVAMNPRGTHLYTYAFNIYGQLQSNTFTQEMVGWGEENYWNIFTKFHWFFGALLGFRLLLLWKNKGKEIFNMVTSYEIIFLVLFFFLGIKSNRNIVFFQIACFPILAKTLEDWMSPLFTKNTWALGAVLAVNYIFVVSDTYYKWFNPNNQFGISIHPEKTPIGAYEYLKNQGKEVKVFADVMSTNFGLWEMRPHYKSYIDLRDLDVFSASFFKNCYTLYQQPDIPLKGGISLWQLADSIDKFDFVLLLNNENFSGLHRYLRQNSSGYTAVYADPLASIYASKRIRVKEEKKIFKPYTFESNRYTIINKFFNPFWVNIEERYYPYEEMEVVWKEL